MIEGQDGVTWDDWVALAETCEEVGVEALYRSDHYISWPEEGLTALDAWSTVAALAARTTRLRFGTLVSPATFRHPAVLARMAATADHVSGGRVEIGMGAGWMEREHAAYGFEFATARERVARFGEQVEIVHRLLTEERVSFAGSYYRLDEAPGAPGVQRPRPPIVVGGSARPGTVEPAVRFADEYNTVYPTLDELRERRRRLDEACERAGRDPATLRYSMMGRLLLGSPARDASAEERAQSFIGDVGEVVARLREVADAGCDGVMLQLLEHRDLDVVRSIGRDLAPAVAS
jgi:F420-dependent oxidoreductase-like protein